MVKAGEHLVAKPHRTTGREYVPREICVICGQRFYAPPVLKRRGGGKCCSLKCAGKYRSMTAPQRKVERICQNCGKSFLTPPSRVKKGRGKYCSNACADEALRVARIQVPCDYCGEILELTYNKFSLSERHYCSSDCYNAGKTKTPETRETKVKAVCEQCGTEFLASKYDAAKGMGRFCSRRCFAAHKSGHDGQKHTRARGGKRPDLDNLYVRSRWEANWARYLNWLQAQGVVESWEYEPETFEFVPIKRGSKFYTPDFRIKFADGHIEYHEVKGYMDAKSKTKLARMAKYYPDIIIVLVDKGVYESVRRDVRSMIPGWE